VKKFVLSVVVAFPLVAGLGAAQAQFGPMVWQQPAPLVWQQPAPMVWRQPAPVVWQQPAPMVWQQPPQVFVPSRAPMVVSPMPVTRVYRTPIVTYQPTRQVVTRQRPFLGGSVSRSTYGYRRVGF
jgi:hypothetical protein